jgi:hypothetical protein
VNDVIIDESLEEPGYAKIVLVKTFWVKDGSVMVYDVEPDPDRDGMYVEGFYLASFDNLSSDVPYGIGASIEDALKSAAERWNKLGADDEADQENPFEEALSQLKEAE